MLLRDFAERPELAVETPDHSGTAISGIREGGDHLDGRRLRSDTEALGKIRPP
jgi:hypothetical protein